MFSGAHLGPGTLATMMATRFVFQGTTIELLLSSFEFSGELCFESLSAPLQSTMDLNVVQQPRSGFSSADETISGDRGEKIPIAIWARKLKISGDSGRGTTVVKGVRTPDCEMNLRTPDSKCQVIPAKSELVRNSFAAGQGRSFAFFSELEMCAFLDVQSWSHHLLIESPAHPKLHKT